MWKVKLMKKVSLEFILDDVTYKKNLNISFLYLRSVIIKRFNVVVLFVCLFFYLILQVLESVTGWN